MKSKSDRPWLRGGNFPLSFCLTFVFVMIGLMGAAAQTYTKQSVRFPRVQIETTFSGGTSSATAVVVDVFAENVLVNGADANDVKGRGNDWQKITFDMLDSNLSATNITAAGKTVTYPQLAALLRQAALDRANAAGVQ